MLHCPRRRHMCTALLFDNCRLHLSSQVCVAFPSIAGAGPSQRRRRATGQQPDSYENFGKMYHAANDAVGWARMWRILTSVYEFWRVKTYPSHRHIFKRTSISRTKSCLPLSFAQSKAVLPFCEGTHKHWNERIRNEGCLQIMASEKRDKSERMNYHEKKTEN